MYWITVIGMFVAALIIKAFSDSTPGEFSTAIAPLAIAGIGFGASALSKLLGGGKNAKLPKEVLDALKANVRNDRTSSFLPDKSAFDANTQAQIEAIFAQLPVSLDQFNAQLGASGTFTSGESTKRRFEDVFAPIAREATSAVTRGNLGFEQLTLQGRIAGDEANQRALRLLVGGSTPQNSGFQEFLKLLGEGGDFATQIGILQKLGVV